MRGTNSFHFLFAKFEIQFSHCLHRVEIFCFDFCAKPPPPFFVCMIKGCILQTLSCSSGSHQDISQFPSVLQGESFQFSELVITAPLLLGAFSVDKCRRSNSSDLTHAAREDSSGHLSSSSILPQFEKYTINIPTRPGQPPLGRKVHYKLGGFVMKRNLKYFLER